MFYQCPPGRLRGRSRIATLVKYTAPMKSVLGTQRKASANNGATRSSPMLGTRLQHIRAGRCIWGPILFRAGRCAYARKFGAKGPDPDPKRVRKFVDFGSGPKVAPNQRSPSENGSPDPPPDPPGGGGTRTNKKASSNTAASSSAELRLTPAGRGSACRRAARRGRGAGARSGPARLGPGCYDGGSTPQNLR